MAANRTTQKRGSAASARSTNGRSALIWGSLAFCSTVAVCGLIALQMGRPGGMIATARVNPVPPPAQPVVQKSPSQSEFEIARLNDAIRTLAAERDRLSARVETLEQSVGDITASINSARKPEPKPEAKPEIASEPEAKPQIKSEIKSETKPEVEIKPEPRAELPPQAPVIQTPVAVEKTPAADTPKAADADQPAPAPSPRAEAQTPAVKPMPREQAVRAPAHPQNTAQNPFFTALNSYMQREEKAAPRPATRAYRIEHTGQKQQIAARPARKTAPLPPPAPPRPAAGNAPATQVAQIMPNQAANPAAQPASQGDITGATQTQFGIDLGGETSLDGLRARWMTLQGKHGQALSGLSPLVRVREGSRPGTVELHLVAGPVANAATAARVCAKLQSTGIACRASEFDGQRLPSR